MKTLLIVSSLFLLLASQTWARPVAKKIPQNEIRFGAVIEDPYKWMENPSDPDLWDWIEEQKNYTAQYLDADLMDVFSSQILKLRKIQKEQDEVTKLSAPLLPKLPIPFDEFRSRFIEWKQDGLSRKMQKSFVTDPTTPKSESELYKIEVKTVHNGDLRRVIISQKSDNKTVDILLVKFYTFVAWADDKSFYYISDQDERIGGGRPALFKHTVGEIQSEDERLFIGKTSSSYLTVHKVGNRFFMEADGTIGAIQLSSGIVTNRHKLQGDVVEMTQSPEVFAIVRSFENADLGELIKLRIRDGKRSLILKEQDFVPEKTKHLGEEAVLIQGLKDASSVAGILRQDQSFDMIPLEDGTIEYLKFDKGVLNLSYVGFAQPKRTLSYELETKKLSVLASQRFPIEIEAEKIHYAASNGQLASLWVLKKKGRKLSQKTPTILFGYGGFEVSITPSFAIYESLPWLEKGGVMAIATLPGSLDYGKSWYEIARVGGRIHSWDSFALAGKELIKRGWTSKDHLGILGASNGGTLVAGTLQRHSDTFKAAVPLVGVMDLLNFTLFTAGKYWTNDYGNPFVEEDFHQIFPLSPYHNLEKRDYPATMVMTAEFDDRVVPMHSFKYLARLQEYNTSSAPILLYNKEWGGHARASGSDRESSRYVAAFYTFFAQHLGL